MVVQSSNEKDFMDWLNALDSLLAGKLRYNKNTIYQLLIILLSVKPAGYHYTGQLTRQVFSIFMYIMSRKYPISDACKREVDLILINGLVSCTLYVYR